MPINNHFTFIIFCFFIIIFTVFLSFVAIAIYVIQKIKNAFLVIIQKDRRIKDEELVCASNCVYCQMFLEARENGWVTGKIPAHFCDSVNERNSKC